MVTEHLTGVARIKGLPKTKKPVKTNKMYKEELAQAMGVVANIGVENSLLKQALGIIVKSIASEGALSFTEDEAKMLEYIVKRYL